MLDALVLGVPKADKASIFYLEEWRKILGQGGPPYEIHNQTQSAPACRFAPTKL